MRTTLSLDDDVAASLEHVQKIRKTSFKQLINDALRAGLKQLTASPGKQHRYHTGTVDLGTCLMNLDNIAETLAVAEQDDFS
ncbi:MAG: DUF2191 domain-containing protein [Acidobacteria bacterium]|nr:MAG: DUF2191 domain-containing protein [Acidobacteriota bacterium]